MLAGGEIDNVSGLITISTPLISNVGTTAGILNSGLGTLDIAAGGAAVNVAVPLSSVGIISVDSGAELDLTSAPNGGGGATIDLNNSVTLSGNLVLLSTATTSQGVTVGGSGLFEIGRPQSAPPPPGSGASSVSAGADVGTAGGGTMTVPGSSSGLAISKGNMEVTSVGELTGGGFVGNSGRLQIDPGGSTNGLGSYTQKSSGVLDIVVSSSGAYSPLTVTGTANLSGILMLPGYVPVVGASFNVVLAGNIENEFNTIPDGMEQTETATTATVTQVQPPGS